MGIMKSIVAEVLPGGAAAIRPAPESSETVHQNEVNGVERHPASEGRAGGCRCGAVRFSVQGEPIRAGLCHCADCRKFSGAPYTFFAVWPREAFTCSGEFATFEGRSFCPACGSRVFSLRDDETEIMVGSLDEAPGTVVPGYELWVWRRESWMQSLPWADQFQGDRKAEVAGWREPFVET
jgi:hypothetical protein